MIDAESFLNEFKDLSKEELIERIHNLYPIVDEPTRIKFLTLLNAMQDNSHFERVENYFISDSNPEVRIEAARLLAFNYHRKKAIKPLIWVIKNEQDFNVQLTAIRLLVALSYLRKFDDIIENTLIDLLKCKDPKIKIEVLQSIGILKIKSAYEELISLLGSSEKKLVKTRAIQALGELKCIKAVPLLIENLGKESYDLWHFSFHALKRILGNGLRDLLVEKLKEMENKEDNYDQSLLKKGLIKAIGEIGNKNQINLLLNLLDDVHYWVRDEVEQSLEKIEPKWREKYKRK